MEILLTEQGKKRLGQGILRAGALVGIAHLLFKLAGLIQAKAMGHYLSGVAYDAIYAFAFENCIFSIFLIAQEIVGPAFLPVFKRELDLHGDDVAWRFANTLLTLQLIILIPVVAVLMWQPEWFVSVWTEWTPERNAEQIRLGATALRRLAPALFGLALGATTYSILNGYKRFFLAAFGDAVWKFAAAGGILAGALFWGEKTAALGLIAGLLLGSVLKVGTHIVGLRDKIRFFRPRLYLNDPAVRAMLWLTLPLILGIVFAKVRDIFNNVYILSPLDSAGLMQANSMGRRLQSTINWLIPYTLGIAAFPFFCEMVDRRDHKQLGEVVTHAGRMLLSIFIPFCAVILFLAMPLTSLLFRGGEFQELAVQRTALSTACYTLVLPAAAIEALTMQAFFANRRMVSVIVAGIVFSALSMLISWLGLRVFEVGEMASLAVIAGGFALSRALKSTTLVVLLRRSAPVFPFGPTVLFLLRTILTAILAGSGTWLALRLWTAVPLVTSLRHINDLLQLAVGGIGGGAGAIAGWSIFRVREPFEMARWALDKTAGRLRQRLEQTKGAL